MTRCLLATPSPPANTYTTPSLTLLDARRRSLDYETVGFKLHPLTSQVKEWQQAAVEGTEDNVAYKAELEKVVRELHPGVKRIAFMTFLLRGGRGENAPAAVRLGWGWGGGGWGWG